MVRRHFKATHLLFAVDHGEIQYVEEFIQINWVDGYDTFDLGRNGKIFACRFTNYFVVAKSGLAMISSVNKKKQS